jgi:hypothetical protein
MFVILPEMMTIFLAVPVTAEVRAASVVTVVVVPPDPPVVLFLEASDYFF